MTKLWRPIYEWHWVRDGKPDLVSRNPASFASFKRVAARLGGTVERRQVGARLNTRATRKINRIATEMMREEEA